MNCFYRKNIFTLVLHHLDCPPTLFLVYYLYRKLHKMIEEHYLINNLLLIDSTTHTVLNLMLHLIPKTN